MKSLSKLRKWFIGLTTMACVSAVEGCVYGEASCYDVQSGIEIDSGDATCFDNYVAHCNDGNIELEECPVQCSRGACVGATSGK